MILLSLTPLSVDLSFDLRYHFFEHLKNGFFSLFPRLLFLFNGDFDSTNLLFCLLSDYKITLLPLLLFIFNHFLHLGKVILEASL